jgi:hypothetical protein
MSVDRATTQGRTSSLDARQVDTAGVVLGAAVLVTGLVAGLFYAFSCAVMPGLARTGDRTATAG